MAKKLIDGLITMSKLNDWFNSLSNKDKVIVMFNLPYTVTDIKLNECINKKYEDNTTFDEFDENEFNFWLYKENNRKKLYGYIVYNKMLSKYKNIKNVQGLIDNTFKFYLLNTYDMVIFLNLTTQFKWNDNQLIDKYNTLSEDEKNTLYSEYMKKMNK